MTFPATKYLCIEEIGRYNDNRFKLSYYQYPITHFSQPFHIFDKNNDPNGPSWTHEYIVKQANNHSMIAWFKARHDKVWDFRTYDFRDNPQGNFNIYLINQEIGIPYGL